MFLRKYYIKLPDVKVYIHILGIYEVNVYIFIYIYAYTSNARVLETKHV